MDSNNSAIPAIKHLIGRWGIHQCLLVNTQEKVHPDDVDKVRKDHAPWLLYYVEDVKGGYLYLRYREQIYRVKPEGFVVVKSPSCWFGDTVLIRRSSGELNEAVVIGPSWHYKAGHHYYRVNVDGKIISRRITEEDILEKR